MRKRNLIIREEANDDISNIIKFISSINTVSAANKYIDNLVKKRHPLSIKESTI